MRGKAAPAVQVGVLVAFAAALLVALPGTAVAEGHEEAWELLERAFADSGRSFEGRLVIVTLAPSGPAITEMRLARTSDGTLLEGASRAWMLGHLDGETLFGDTTSGRLLRLAGGRASVLSSHKMEHKYEAAVERSADGPGGASTVVVVREGDRLRERFVIDDDAGIVVRRETYDGEGKPVRLAAFTSLSFGPVELPTLGTGWVRSEVSPTRAAVTRRGADILHEVGWVVPDELPGGFERVDVSALGDGDGSTLRLLYSDGLYSMSLYEQTGRLDTAALLAKGAEPTRLGSGLVYRWPGSEPAPYVWTGGGYTFTVVSDAPPDVLASALVGLPNDGGGGLLTRIRRGFTRMLDWLTPWS